MLSHKTEECRVRIKKSQVAMSGRMLKLDQPLIKQDLFEVIKVLWNKIVTLNTRSKKSEEEIAEKTLWRQKEEKIILDA